MKDFRFGFETFFLEFILLVDNVLKYNNLLKLFISFPFINNLFLKFVCVFNVSLFIFSVNDILDE